MKCCYESCMPKPWALILALILSFAATTALLPEQLSLVSTATLTAYLMAVLKVAYGKAVIPQPRWKLLFQIHSPDDGVPLIAVSTAYAQFAWKAT